LVSGSNRVNDPPPQNTRQKTSVLYSCHIFLFPLSCSKIHLQGASMTAAEFLAKHPNFNFAREELEMLEHRELLILFRLIAMKAADALWALKRGKQPDDDPNQLNQALHNLRPYIDKILAAYI
jgi:hypothetical protein